MTIVSFGIGMTYALEAADKLAADGISAEVIDLRTLRPIDYDTVLASVMKTNRCVTIEEGFPVTICDPRAVDLAEAAVTDLFGPPAWRRLERPIMGAEDFSYVLEQVPGAMLFLGVSHEGEDWTQCCGIHSTRMLLDETVLPQGAALLAGLAERFLERGFG